MCVLGENKLVLLVLVRRRLTDNLNCYLINSFFNFLSISNFFKRELMKIVCILSTPIENILKNKILLSIIFLKKF